MRDANRLYGFYNKLTALHIQHVPDWRFGQLMFNFMSECGNPFYWEEDKFLEEFEKYLTGLKQPNIER